MPADYKPDPGMGPGLTHVQALAKVDDLKRSYEAKVDDLRRETRRTSAALAACRLRPPRYVVGEALLGWEEAMHGVERALTAQYD